MEKVIVWANDEIIQCSNNLVWKFSQFHQILFQHKHFLKYKSWKVKDGEFYFQRGCKSYLFSMIIRKRKFK